MTQMKIIFPNAMGKCAGPVRVSFFEWLFYRAWIATGTYEDGGIVPRPLYPLWFLARPMDFIQGWFGCDHRVPNMGRYRIEGVELSGIFFSQMKGGTVPGPWMRIVRNDGGLTTWEEMK